MARQMPLLQSTLLLLLVLLLAGHVLAFAPFTNLLGQTESVVGIISMPYANASAMLRAFDESVKPIGAVNLSLPWTGPGAAPVPLIPPRGSDSSLICFMHDDDCVLQVIIGCEFFIEEHRTISI